MARFIDPSGHTTYGIALCDRCHKKFCLDELFPDPNAPGLRVCREDLDEFDPWRLPARPAERISLPFVRPDLPLTGHATSFTLAVPLLVTQSEDYVVTENGDYIELSVV